MLELVGFEQVGRPKAARPAGRDLRPIERFFPVLHAFERIDRAVAQQKDPPKRPKAIAGVEIFDLAQHEEGIATSLEGLRLDRADTSQRKFVKTADLEKGLPVHGHTAACGRSRQQIDSAFGFDQMIHFRFEWIVS
ncbi:MAG: hypothetical protein KH181_08150 [Subdoligranulum variabile]|nr:hypothetical protein [Subdoligranulum variabile]